MKMTAPLERVLRAFLADPADPRYGYDLMKAAGLKSGTLYPLLGRLEDEKLVTSAWETPQQDGQRPRKYYRLTAEGAEVARLELAQVSAGRRGSPARPPGPGDPGMRGERRLLRIGEYLIARACRHLPAGARDERYREWVAELPAILGDPGVRPAARRAARMLRYASGTIRGTALTPGSARRVMAHTARAAAPWIIAGLVGFLWRLAKTPHEWISVGIGCLLGTLLGSLIAFGCRLAYRRWGKGLGEAMTAAVESRARTRAQARARAACILQARASAGSVNSTAG